MLKNSIKTLSLGGAALALAATGAFAQTSSSSTVNTNQTPAAIGVTPQTAKEANQKAIQRADTGTVVRTDGTAAEQVRDAANRMQKGANMTGATTGTTRPYTTPADASGTNNATNNATSSTHNTDRPAVGTTAQRRAARADRN